jgi:hypothetical protein
MIGSERLYFNDARTGYEPAHCFVHQRAANAGAARVLVYDKPADVVNRLIRGEEQAAEQIAGSFFGGDESCASGDVPCERRVEAWFTGHRAEPVLDLQCERRESECAILMCRPDEHHAILSAAATSGGLYVG